MQSSRADLAGGLEQVAGQLSAVCRVLDPEAVAADAAVELQAVLTWIVQLADGARVRLARRAVDVPTDRGARDRMREMAQSSGRSLSEVKAEVDLSADLTDRPHMDAALASGALSPAERKAISGAVRQDAEADADLVGAAASGEVSLAELRRRARQAMADTDPSPAATRRRHHQRRRFSAWQEDDGEWNARLSGPADIGAAITAALKGFTDDAFAAARSAGRREGEDAYRFDGLVTALTGRTVTPTGLTPVAPTPTDTAPAGTAPTDTAPTSPAAADPTTAGSTRAGRGRERKVIGIIDIAALTRGHPLPGETCHLAGVGPVPVDTIRSMLGDATTALLFRRGTTDLAVAHLGRHPTAFQRTALEARDYVCAITGCGHTRNLEIDHVRDWATTRRTITDDLDWLCPHHHRQKTRGHITLTGPPGRRRPVPAAAGSYHHGPAP